MAEYNSDRTGANIDAVLDKADNLTQAAVGVGGNVGIGTASPHNEANYKTLEIAGSFGGSLRLTNNSTVAYEMKAQGALLHFGSETNHPIMFKTNDTERARIDSSGNLLVGKTSADNTTVGMRILGSEGFCSIVRDGAEPLVLNRLTSDGSIVQFRKNGATVGSISVTGSATSYNTSSDERLKENIQDTTHSVDIDDIQVREFDWKVDGSHQRYGFIAQELETVYPEAVHSPEDADEMKSVDYSKLVPLLVKEIQQLKAEIKELKA